MPHTASQYKVARATAWQVPQKECTAPGVSPRQMVTVQTAAITEKSPIVKLGRETLPGVGVSAFGCPSNILYLAAPQCCFTNTSLECTTDSRFDRRKSKEVKPLLFANSLLLAPAFRGNEIFPPVANCY